ncbi:MAG: alpha/beta hydrolase [Oscillospiraceae bacterium]|nr:alpha/beta hydrolase [Oscillospiraceae bacterium]
MTKNRKKSIAALLTLLILTLVCMYGADRIQRSGAGPVGSVDVREGAIDTEVGSIAYKLYVPQTATEAEKAPAVLLLHGYQNDHETCSAFAIELARRGVVVMSADEYGHGSTDIGLLRRGYVNQKVKVNFGEDSEADGTFVRNVGGPARYRLMMNFSNLSFFDDRYTKDDAGNSISDSSCGGITAYRWLAAQPFVDSSRMGLSGHSMGTWSSWTVAAQYSGTDIEPKATVLQCGELFRKSAYDSDKIHFNNVLLLQAKYDEFSYFRDYRLNVTDDLLATDLRKEFLGANEAGEWNRTYGSFSDGSARRIELLMTNHRLTTHDSKGIAVALDWFESALGGAKGFTAADTSQVYMVKELLVLAAMLFAVSALIPAADLLLSLAPFSGIVQTLPSEEGMITGKKWKTGVLAGVLITGITYPFMTQLGHGLLPLPEKVFRMTIGNGFLSWYGLLIIVFLIMTAVRLKKRKAAGDTCRFHDLGMAESGQPDRFSWRLLGKSLALSALLFMLLYTVTAVCEALFGLDLRFIWPFFRAFSLTRLLQFFVYLPVYILFFTVSTSRSIALMRTKATYEPGAGGFFWTWLRTAMQMAGGVLLITLLEYIPFFAGIGPGADVLFGSTFGGPFMSLLIVFVPQIIVFSLLCTYMYRRTGNVFTGALVSAAMACWIVTGGSSILY